MRVHKINSRCLSSPYYQAKFPILYYYVASVSEEKAALCISGIVYDAYSVNINYIMLRYYVYCEVFVYLFAKGLFRFSLPDFILVKK